MILRCIFCVLASYMIFSLTIAHGQTQKKIIYKEKSYYDFQDTLIRGNLRKPDGSFIFRKNQTEFQSSLNLKRSFIPELKATAKDAR